MVRTPFSYRPGAGVQSLVGKLPRSRPKKKKQKKPNNKKQTLFLSSVKELKNKTKQQNITHREFLEGRVPCSLPPVPSIEPGLFLHRNSLTLVLIHNTSCPLIFVCLFVLN